MNKSTVIPALLTAGLTLLLTPSARAWQVWHHQVIAEIAETRLRPETRREVDLLLGPRHRMVDEAGWADYIRGYWWWTAPWHYINWPLELDQPDFEVLATRRGNVVSAIEEQFKIFRERHRNRQDRLEALKFIIHFVGDVHQPLHCGKGEDRGGNNIPVRFRGKLTNLHSAWDGTIYDDRGDSPAEHAQRLLAELKAEEMDKLEGGTPYDWAVESHRIDREFVYPRLEDLAVRGSASVPPEVSGPYAEAAQPIMRRRLLQAGLRLAGLLNEVGQTVSSGPAAPGEPPAGTSKRAGSPPRPAAGSRN